MSDLTDHRRTDEDLRARLRELTVLYENSAALGQRLPLQVIGQRVLMAVESLLRWKRGSLWVLNEAGDKIELLAHSEMGLEPEALEAELRRVRGIVRQPGAGISGWVALHGQAIRSGNVKTHPAYLEADPTIQSELCVPLMAGGRCLGSVNVESEKANAFTAQDERLLTTLANAVAIALENHRYFEKLQSELVERQRAEAGLAKNEALLRLIIETEPECVKLVSRDGTLLEMNAAGLAMIEADSLAQVRGRPLLELLAPEHRRAFHDLMGRVFAGGSGALVFEITGLRGTRRWLETTAVPLREDGRVTALLGVTRDITEQRAAEDSLSRQARQTQQLLETMLDGYILADLHGRIVDVNPAYCAMSGYRREELLAMNIRQVEGKLSPAEIEARIALMVANNGARFGTQHLTRDGRRLELEVSAAILQTEQAPLVAAFVRDVTARNQADHELAASRGQLRALVARLQRTREEERIRVSREIHDVLGQLLTSLKMDTRWLERKLSEPGGPSAINPLLERAVEASHLADTAIAAVQKIAAELRPSTLDALGLSAALRQEARRLQERTGISCQLVAPEPFPHLPRAVANELFHIAQEALTNVVRHARAHRVEIHLRVEDGAVLMEVRDDGIGTPENALAAADSLGLIGMRERAMQVGGTITFLPNETGGTRLVVRVRERMHPGAEEAG